MTVSGPAVFPLLISGICLVVGTAFYYFALERNPLSLVGTLTALYPAVTVLVAVLFLGESFSFVQVIGLAMIVGGVVLVSR